MNNLVQNKEIKRESNNKTALRKPNTMANSGLFKTSYLNENKSLRQKRAQIVNINDESESANSPDLSQRAIGGREENQSCFGKI
mgnify:CR=1 FL=1